jgi:hypothetical protein
MLREAGALIAVSVEHGRELRRLMTPSLPPIRVPSLEKRIAA